MFSKGVACWRLLPLLFVTAAVLNCVLCQEEVYIEYEVLEEQSPQTFIGNVASDSGLPDRYQPEVLSQLRFAFLVPSEYFVMESHSGLLWTAETLDRDAICPYSSSCEIKLDIAVQPVQYFQIIKVRVQLVDLNDNQPAFDQARISLEISETTMPGATFALPSAQDLDSGLYGVKGYALRSSTDTFDLQVSGNEEKDVHLVIKDKLDREGQDFYTLTLIASDGGVPPKTGSIAIDIAVIDANDNNPRFSNYSYEVYINENIPTESVIIQLQAYDPDEGENGQIVYEFSRNTQDAYGHLFHLNQHTGEITVTGSIDYEVGSEYNLAVVARDRGPSALAAYTKVIVRVWDINDHAPQVTINTMTPSGNAEIMEDSLPGTFVAHISVMDPDGGINGEFTCNLDNPAFELQKLYKSEFKLVSTRVFDREAQPDLSVNLICEDKGRLAQSSTTNIPVVVLDKNDHAPVFFKKYYSVSFQENNAVHQPVIKVNASDEDLGNNAEIRYSVYDEDGFESSYLSVQELTGQVKTRISFDYEQRSSYRFLLVATDKGESPKSATATLSIQVTDANDEPPKFFEDMYHFKPLEEQDAGAEVGRVEAYDVDTFPYNEITYSLHPGSPDRDIFSVDRMSGEISSVQVLDREVRSKYMLIVAAENEGYHMSSTVVVSVMVADRNDNSPEILFPSAENNTAQISVSAERGDEVLAIKAMDLDTGPNGALRFTIMEQDQHGLFLIDPTRGVVSANGDLRDYADQTLGLVIQVEDHGNPSLSSTQALNIFVNSTMSAESSLLLDRNLVIVICLAILALVLILLVVLVVALLRRRREQRRRNHRYNCRVEATKALVGITTETGKNGTKVTNSNNDGQKKEVSFNLNDNGGYGERSRSPWPVINQVVIPNQQGVHGTNVAPPPRYDELTPQHRSTPSQLQCHRNSLEVTEMHNLSNQQEWQRQQQQQQQQRSSPSFREETRHRLLYQPGDDKPLTQLHLQVHDLYGTGRLDLSDSDRGSLTDSGRGPSEEGDHLHRDDRPSRKSSQPGIPPHHHGNQMLPSNPDSVHHCDRPKAKTSTPRNLVYPTGHHGYPGSHSNTAQPGCHWNQSYLPPGGSCRDLDSVDGMSDGGTTTSGSYVVDPDHDVLELEDATHISSDVFV